jgi:hypothetical protein
MGWKVVARRIGRAGGYRRRSAQQRQWDQAYGEGNWAVGYVVDGSFVLQDDAVETVYYRSYEHYLDQHPEDVEELVRLARELRNPHAVATTGVDLQVPAIVEYLHRRGLRLAGTQVVDIGSWQGQASHPISVRLSPLQIPVIGNPKMTLEQFWQAKKCLAVWVDDHPAH